MAKKNFEQALAGLEQITKDLEQGNFSLEESLKKFEEGMKLADFCNQTLENAQKKVDILLKKDGKLAAVPIEDVPKEKTK